MKSGSMEILLQGDLDEYYMLSSGCSSNNGVTLALKKDQQFFSTQITTGIPLLAKETSASMYSIGFGP